MPTSPSPAQSAASRANGARSRGPATPEHAAGLADLREPLPARLGPVDAVERHWVGEIAFGLWQQQRLHAVTAAALAHAEVGTDDPDAPRPPSLATLARYRARIERDLRLAQQGFEAARGS